MIVLRESYANIGEKRLKGDVIKENKHTTWMNFYPPKKMLERAKDLRITLKPIMHIKRHNKKHRVNRFA